MIDGAARDFEPHRAFLTGIAYRMLGSVAEAEDVVQDAFLRWYGADRDAVAVPRAWLAKTVTRLALDRLKSARRTREVYIGEWLPEPLVEDPATETVAGDVSYALMLALERLSPLERAAFLLHDLFDMTFDEIAAALDRDSAACRQLAARARTHVRAARPRFALAPDEGERVADAFFAATRSGDAAALRTLLTDNAVLHSDGGGRRLATINPIRGAERIGRFFGGLVRKGRLPEPAKSLRCMVNGMPGAVTVEADGTVQATALEIAGGRVAAIYIVRNPDKLAHVAALLAASGGATRH